MSSMSKALQVSFNILVTIEKAYHLLVGWSIQLQCCLVCRHYNKTFGPYYHLYSSFFLHPTTTLWTVLLRFNAYYCVAYLLHNLCTLCNIMAHTKWRKRNDEMGWKKIRAQLRWKMMLSCYEYANIRHLRMKTLRILWWSSSGQVKAAADVLIGTKHLKNLRERVCVVDLNRLNHLRNINRIASFEINQPWIPS